MDKDQQIAVLREAVEFLYEAWGDAEGYGQPQAAVLHGNEFSGQNPASKEVQVAVQEIVGVFSLPI